MLASERFEQVTGRQYLYNFMPLSNMPSVLQHGILCYDLASGIRHDSIAMDDVQEKRDARIMPGGWRLHQYANLYFDRHNPMLYKRKDMAESFCILVVRAEVMDLNGVLLTDQNAVNRMAKFYGALEGVERIEFKQVYAKYWTSDDRYLYMHQKSVKCAEVLVPEKVPSDYIVGAIVVNDEVLSDMRRCGFKNEIAVKPEFFYR